MYILSSLSTNLPILYTILLKELLISRRKLLFNIITLIYKTENIFIIICILFSLFDPKGLQILKGFRVINITY